MAELKHTLENINNHVCVGELISVQSHHDHPTSAISVKKSENAPTNTTGKSCLDIIFCYFLCNLFTNTNQDLHPHMCCSCPSCDCSCDCDCDDDD